MGIGRITKEEKARRDELAEQGIKVCSNCKREKNFIEFSKNSSKDDGLQNTCKRCVREYKQKNSKRIKEQTRQYRQRPEVKERINKQERKARESNPVFRVGRNIRKLLWQGFKQKGWLKDSSAGEIIGCPWEQVVLWLGGEPNENMHIDHVIPQSLATTEEELILLNHYTNLQLLKAEENTSKGNRYIRSENLNRVLTHHPQPSKLREMIGGSDIEIK